MYTFIYIILTNTVTKYTLIAYSFVLSSEFVCMCVSVSAMLNKVVNVIVVVVVAIVTNLMKCCYWFQQVH